MKRATSASDDPTKTGGASPQPRRDAWETPDALLCVMNHCGRFVHVNAAWSNVLGWTPADVAQRAFLDLIHPDDISKASCALAALSYGETVPRLDIRCRGFDGAYRSLSCRARPQAGKFYWAAESGEACPGFD